MSEKTIFGYFAPALKGKDLNKGLIRSTEIKQGSELYSHLCNIFSNSTKECDISIRFLPENGEQKNIMRTMLQNFLKDSVIENGIPIVERLCSFTDQKTKDGLLFIIINKETINEICIARFPSETGIMVKNNTRGLEFEIKDDVFLKNSRRYKAIYFSGSNIDFEFWDGKAVDRQINSEGLKDISEYWIHDFFLCELKMTPKRGSRLFARAMQKAIEKTENDITKQEIISLSSLLANKKGKTVSIKGILEEYQVSDDAKNTVLKQFQGNEKEIAETKFRMDIEEYFKYFNYQFVFMNNGAIIVATSNKFDKVWSKEVADNSSVVKYSTEGSIQRIKIGSRI